MSRSNRDSSRGTAENPLSSGPFFSLATRYFVLEGATSSLLLPNPLNPYDLANSLGDDLYFWNLYPVQGMVKI